MKAEHRKELHTNALADRLGKWLQELRSGPTTNTLLFWGFIVLVVALVAGWTWYYRSATASNSAMWASLDSANSVEDLDKLIKDHPGTSVARIAQFEKARVLLRQGLDHILSEFEKEREDSVDRIKQSAELYEKLSGEVTDNPVLMQEALFGAGKAYESLGDLDKAIEFYQTRWPEKYADTPLGKAAAKQAEMLEKNRETASQFYEELKKLTAAQPKKE